MLLGVSLFVPLDCGRFGLWLLALAGGAIAFAALGVAIGSLAREVRAASLLAFVLVAAARVPRARAERRRLAAALRHHPGHLGGLPVQGRRCEAIDAAINGSDPAIGQSLAHLAGLIVVFGVAARAGLRRFA